MEQLVYLDTHVALWLYAGEVELLSAKASASIDKNSLLISPLVLLEMQYLLEVKRIKVTPVNIFDSLTKELGVSLCERPLEQIIYQSLKYGWTRDPFDRLITAQASLDHNVLITKDESILKHYPHAVW